MCCSRHMRGFLGELVLPPFATTDATGKSIDIKLAFAVSSRGQLLFKSLCSVWSLAVILHLLFTYGQASFFLAYLTHWSLLTTQLYFLGSTILSSWPNLATCTTSALQQQHPDQEQGLEAPGKREERPSWLLKAIWCLYSTSATTGIIVSFLYWFENEKGFTYLGFMAHGGITLLLLFEGSVVNCVPVFWSHITFGVLFGVSYLSWTLIHSLLLESIGNPNNPKHDAVYGLLDWKQKPAMASAVAVVTLFVLMPLSLAAVRTLSMRDLRCRPHRRYVVDDDS